MKTELPVRGDGMLAKRADKGTDACGPVDLR